MKKGIAVFLILSILFCSIPAVAETYNSFSYFEEDGEIIVTGYSGNGGFLNIPSRIDGKTVTKVDAFAFAYGSFSSVSFPATITSIGNGAFLYCENLTSVSLSENILSVGDSAFFGCSSLKYAKIPQSVEYMGIDVFSECNEEFYIKGYENSCAQKYAEEYGYEFESLGEGEDLSIISGNCGDNAFFKLSRGGVLTIYGEGETCSLNGEIPWSDYKNDINTVIISEGITSVFEGAFREMPALSSLSLPEGLISIGDRAFEKCPLIRATEIPQTVKSIGNMAFGNCDSLQKIILPASVESVGYNAFESCDKLKMVKLSEGISSIGNYTFMNCTSLYSVSIPSTLESIPSGCFSACNSLEEITIPEGVESIYYSAFSSCPIKSVTLPVTVTSIYDRAFDSSVIIKGYDGTAAESYAESNGNTFESMGTVPDMILEKGEWGSNVSWTIDSSGTLTISGTGVVESTSSYSDYPWNGKGYTDIVIKEGITELSDYMFYQSPAVYVKLPSSLRVIGMYAFSSANKIEKIIIPEGVTEIGICAFRSCRGLTEAHIPSSVIQIRTDLYPFDRCLSSLTLYVYEGTAGEYAAQVKGTNYVSLPLSEEKVVIEEKYDENINWSITNKGKLTVWAETPVELPSYTQFPWRSITGVFSLCVGENITSVGTYAFYENSAIKEVEFSEYVSLIENNAFGYYSSLKVKGYEGSAAETFSEKNGYTFESMGDAPSVIVAQGDFSECDGSWKIDSAGVLTISGKGEIYDYNTPWDTSYNKRIKKIVIEEGVNSINYGLTYKLENLREAVLPASLIMIYDALFPYSAVVYGYSGTVSESWANEYGYTFESLGEAPDMIVMEGTAGEDTVYTLDTKGVLTISGDGYVSNKPWMQFSSAVRKIIVESGITGFTSNVFEEMENLKEAEFSSGMNISRMGNIFYACHKLEKIVFPPVAVLESYFLQDCDGISEIILPENLKSVYTCAIYGCDNLKRVEFPASVTSIGNDAVYYCGGNVKIAGYNGTAAQKYAQSSGYTFESLGNPSLKEPLSGYIGNVSWNLNTDGVLTLDGEGMLDIGYYLDAPWYTYKDYVTKVVIGGGIIYTGNYAFYNHKSLTEAVLEKGVKQIGPDTFSGCTALSKVTLPEGLEYIGNWAFGNCISLKEVIIPESVNYIDGAFYNNANGFTIKGYSYSVAEDYANNNGFKFISIGVMERQVVDSGVDNNGIYWEFDNYGELAFSGYGYMQDYTMNNIPWEGYPVKRVTIEEGVMSVGNFAFNGMSELKSVSLPDGIIRIGMCAFYDCGQMEMLRLPDSVEIIGSEAFAYCWRGIIAGENILSIEANAFSGIKVYGVPGSFVETYASMYEDVRFFPVTDGGKCGDNLYWEFDVTTGILDISGNGEMYNYPLENWEGTAPWYPYRAEVKKVEMGDGISYIGEYALYELRADEIILPSTLREIGKYALSTCYVEEITIPEGCVAIREGAFEWNDNLEKVVIPASVEIIENGAFDWCDNVVLHVYEGTAGESYAINYYHNYELIKPAPEIGEIYTTLTDTTIYASINVKNADESVVWVGAYGENNKLLGAVTAYKTGENEYRAVISATGAEKIKCFVWESTENMKPLCNPKEAEIN